MPGAVFALWSVLALGGGGRADGPALCLETGGHIGDAKALAFAASGDVLVSVGLDRTLRVWEVASGELLRTLRVPAGNPDEGRLFAVAVSPLGDLVAAAGAGYWSETTPIWLLDPATAEVVGVVHVDKQRYVCSLAFSPDGRRLAVGLDADEPFIYSLDNHETMRLSGGKADLQVVAWSPDGSQLATGGTDGLLHLWNAASGAALRDLSVGQRRVMRITWHPDGHRLVVAATGADHRTTAVVFDVVTGAAVELPSGSSGIAVRPDGGRLFAGGFCYDAVGGTFGEPWTVRCEAPGSRTLTDAAWTPDLGFVAAAAADGRVHLWDGATAQRVRSFMGTAGDSLESVAWSDDGSLIGWGRAGNPWDWPRPTDVTTAFELRTLTPCSPAGRAWVSAVVQQGGRSVNRSQDRTELLVGDGDDAARWLCRSPWDAPGTKRQIYSATLAPGDQVAVGAQDMVRLYGADGREACWLYGMTGPVTGLAASPDGCYLAGVATDQVVRVWSLDPRRWTQADNVVQAAPLLNAFMGTDGEWIVWTQEGYYAGSPGGEHCIGWLVNHGYDRLPSYYSAAQFHDQFYRPDIIARVLDAGSVEAAIAQADAARQQATDPHLVAANLETFAPPDIHIVEPRDGAVVDADEIVVQADVAGANREALDQLKLVVNARPQDRGRFVFVPSRDRPGGYSAMAPLLPGENRLLVYGRTTNGTAALSRSIRVFRPEPATEQHKPTLYLLAVGVAKYQQAELSIDFADRDAADLATAWSGPAGNCFGTTKTKVLTDAEATKGAILDGLQWLEDHAEAGDYAVVFLAGHGVNDPRGNYYFLPHDVDLDALKRTGLIWSDVLTTLTALQSRVMLILDTCHAGAGGGDSGLAAVLRDAGQEKVGVITFAACLPHQQSLPHAASRHGAFSAALLEAIGGKADLNRDGSVTIAETDAYVADRVPELTDGRQLPAMSRPMTVPSSLVIAAANAD